MFHRVDAIGENAEMCEASLDAELCRARDGSGDWVVEDHGTEVARYPDEALRVSLSWKAEVYRDESARRVRADHEADLTLEFVVDRFLADLADRGIVVPRPTDPLGDPSFIAALSEVYRLPDLVYPTEAETAARASGH